MTPQDGPVSASGHRDGRPTHGPRAIPAMVDRLHELAEGRECISLGELVRTIGAQGHSPLLMVCALLMVLPTGMIPGIGGALGLIVAIIGLQMLRGRSGIWVPKMFAKREFTAEHICKLAEWIRPHSERVHRHMRIRAEWLAEGSVSLSVVAVILMISGGSLVVLGAIPVATPLMGLPVALYALGILARDGVVVGIAHVLVVAVSALGFYIQMGG